MRKSLYCIMIMALGSLAYGQVSIGVDVYNRYVWRGTDFGNSASVQPNIEYTKAGVTLGAWGAWSTTGAPGGNENDLYLTTSLGPLDLTLTDYFFPNYGGTDKILTLDNHIIELSAGMDLGPVTSLVALNISGDDDNSAYVELAYGPVILGMGNGFYTVRDDPDFNIVSIGVSASRDIYSVSYILNPEQETSFLVFGFSI